MPRWTPEQQLAIDTSGTNIIVSAGAGSGKTAVLTERVITKLRQGISINELLILTFTKAAASEMKERIRKAIKKDPSLHKQLELIDTAYITTFDSYALSVVKKYHYLLNVSKDINIGNDNVLKLEKKKIIDTIFEEMYEKEDSYFLTMINDLCSKDDEEIRNYVFNLYEKLSLRIDKKEYLENYLNDYYQDIKLDNYVREYEELIKDELTSVKKLIEDISYIVDEKYYQSLVEVTSNLLEATTYDEIKSCIDIKIPMLPRGSEEEVKAKKDELSDSIKKIKEWCCYENREVLKHSLEKTKPYVEALISILKQYDLKIQEYKFVNDIYEFTDIAILAINILENYEEVRDEIKYSLKEILVDEYQDTSDLQEAFIKQIENNNVYMVGDVKQSIYRFRNANPYIFKNKYDHYSNKDGGLKIDLNKNFRSRNEVLDDINLLFDFIMDDNLGGADYRSTHRMVFGNMMYEEQGKTDSNHHMSILRYPYEIGSLFSKEEIEAFIIAKDIENKVSSGYLVFDKETSSLRPSTYSDYVILMDRTTNFELYKKIFEYLNIPLAIHKDEVLTNEIDSLVLKNLLCLIKKISEKKFDVEFKYYFTSVARSFLLEYKDPYIFEMFAKNDFKNNELYKKCEIISKQLDALTPVELLDIVLKEFSFYENIIKIGNISAGLIRIDYYSNLSKELMSLGYDAACFIDYLKEIIDNEYDMKYSVDLGNIDSVKMMTIHKSKGLEYPICYFSGLYKPFNISDLKERILYDGEYGIITPYFMEGIGEVITKKLLKMRFYKEEISEKIRLLYVALTRAREHMIFVLPTTEKSNPVENLVEERIRFSYRSFADILNSVTEKIDMFTNTVELNDVSLSKDYLLTTKKELNILESNHEKLEVEEVIIPKINKETESFSKHIYEYVPKEQQENIDLGLKMHSILENMDLKKPNYDLIEDDFYKQKVISFINKMPNLDSADIYQEYEFLYDENNKRYHGIIDLLIEFSDNIWIIDYKLKNVKDEAYIKQLNGYKKYIEDISKKPVKISLYSILDECFEEVM